MSSKQFIQIWLSFSGLQKRTQGNCERVYGIDFLMLQMVCKVKEMNVLLCVRVEKGRKAENEGRLPPLSSSSTASSSKFESASALEIKAPHHHPLDHTTKYFWKYKEDTVRNCWDPAWNEWFLLPATAHTCAHHWGSVSGNHSFCLRLEASDIRHLSRVNLANIVHLAVLATLIIITTTLGNP